MGSYRRGLRGKNYNPVLFLMLFASVLLLPLLFSCGGGGGSSGSSSTAPDNTMSIYSNNDPTYGAILNVPYVTIYINGKPFNLLLDTGATGIMVNSQALADAGVNLPQTNNYFSGYFGDNTSFSGYVTNADTVSTLPSGGLTATNIPIAVATTDTAFPSNGLIQGDFGMGLSPFVTFGNFNGANQTFSITPSLVQGLSAAAYSNGFILNFNSNLLNNDGYAYINSNQSIGSIIFGLNTEPNNNVSSGYTFFRSDPVWANAPCPVIDTAFGLTTADSYGFPFYSYFDTGANFILLGSDALSDSISNFTASEEYNCDGATNIVMGGLPVAFHLSNPSSNSYSDLSFITSPDDKNLNYEFCPSNIPNNNSLLVSNFVIDMGNSVQNNPEAMGLPFMLNRSMYWQAPTLIYADPPPNRWNISTWGVGIKQ